MPFISQRDIALSIRQKAEKEYRDKLRAALQNPALTREQRQDLRARLERVGEPRIYDADSPPPPGAIQLPDPPVVRLSAEELEDKKKTELVEMARSAGLPVSGNKARLIERLINAGI